MAGDDETLKTWVSGQLKSLVRYPDAELVEDVIELASEAGSLEDLVKELKELGFPPSSGKTQAFAEQVFSRAPRIEVDIEEEDEDDDQYLSEEQIIARYEKSVLESVGYKDVTVTDDGMLSGSPRIVSQDPALPRDIKLQRLYRLLESLKAKTK